MDKGTCQCGCGQATTIARVTDRAKGYVRGEPIRFVKGHNNRLRLGPANPLWRGDEACLEAIHAWVRKHGQMVGRCSECGGSEPRTEWSNIDHRYRRDLSDWRELCSRCHRYYDHDVLGVYNPCIEQAA